jgi:hypothetical protein
LSRHVFKYQPSSRSLTSIGSIKHDGFRIIARKGRQAGSVLPVLYEATEKATVCVIFWDRHEISTIQGARPKEKPAGASREQPDSASFGPVDSLGAGDRVCASDATSDRIKREAAPVGLPSGAALFLPAMTLWLRRSGLVSPADADRADYLVIEHEKVVGRIYEDRHTPAEYRWFWSITEYVDPALGISTRPSAQPRGGEGAV